MQHISYRTQLELIRYNLCKKDTHQNIKQKKLKGLLYFIISDARLFICEFQLQ